MEINFGCKAIQEIADNLLQFSADEKMYICYKLREIDEGALVVDNVTPDGDPSFDIRFNMLSNDQIQTIWELTDKHVRIKREREHK